MHYKSFHRKNGYFQGLLYQDKSLKEPAQMISFGWRRWLQSCQYGFIKEILQTFLQDTKKIFTIVERLIAKEEKTNLGQS